MALNAKQLEELAGMQDVADSLHDATGDSDKFDETTEGALAWRRSMIEKAAANVKKALRRAIDAELTYEIHSLLFDKKALKFGRVVQSKPNLLKLEYVSGGLTLFNQGKDSSARKIKAKKAKTSARLQALRNTKTSLKKPAKVTEEISGKSRAGNLLENESVLSPSLKEITKSRVARKKTATTKTPAKKAATSKSKAKTKTKAVKTKRKLLSSSEILAGLPAGVTTDPVVDPNGYIQQNFQYMSNKELASITGLSEHTIRRKLGEWDLKRLHRIKNKK